MTFEEYVDLRKEQGENTLLKGKVESAARKDYCDAHGLDYDENNPPKAAVKAGDQ